MRVLFTRTFDPGERQRLAGFFGGVGLLHVAGWGLLLMYGASHPGFLALGGLAYTFGLRHAFDADHIAAIDNTTRKLLQSGRRPAGVGFFFSLGHSTVVFLIAVALGLAVRWIEQGVVADNGELRNIGGAIGTLVSGAFLVLIGVMNLVVLLAIAAGAAAQGLPFAAVISLPLIFASGMSLMDTMDGAFMSKAYSWAFASPVRKIFYNLTITSLSVFVALFVGLTELAQILIHVLDLRGPVFGAIAGFDVIGKAGFVIVGVFVATWAAALVIYRVRRIDERWGQAMDRVA